MIKSIKAENYKSIKSLELELGRVNVFIGENGAGKSNILEVFALAGAALNDKLDNEFLTSRGIRATEPEFMRPAFAKLEVPRPILISMVEDEGDEFSVELNNDNLPYSKWSCDLDEIWAGGFIHDLIDREWRKLKKSKKNIKLLEVSDINDDPNEILSIEFKRDSEAYRFALKQLRGRTIRCIEKFIIFSPENSALRIFQREGQIEPLGINGEGLLKLLSVLSREEYGETLQEIKESLKALCWFEDFKLIEGDTFAPRRIAIKDRYIEDTGRYFDQMSANEGFLFLLFYFALFSTSLTPSIFAIDNIDASLNPALCEKLLRELVKLAKKHDKQVLLTTHNPAVLDGLNLNDDEQRLFVVSRNQAGETRVRRIQVKPQTPGKEKPVRLSEMFMRGLIGGIPAGF